MPVLQAVVATTKRAAWADSPRGLGAADLAMHVVLPELDGRVLAGAIAFKDPCRHARRPGIHRRSPTSPSRTGSTLVADRVAALVRCSATPRGERRIAVLMPDYPGAPGRTGYAVGLDVPASVMRAARRSRRAGYAVSRRAAKSSKALLDALEAGSAEAILPLEAYAQSSRRAFRWRSANAIRAAWGAPADDPDVRDGAFHFRAHAFGNVVVALPPDRGRADSRRADYHDPALPPRHALLAFGLWLRQSPRRCARPHGRARHAGMAARQGRRADGGLLPRSGGRAHCR